MRKLKLDLDDLKVESFETTPEIADAKGTVYGYATEFGDTCVASECGSCQGTCFNTCGNTCGDTCGTCANTCPNTCDLTCLSACTATCGCGGGTNDDDCEGYFR